MLKYSIDRQQKIRDHNDHLSLHIRQYQQWNEVKTTHQHNASEAL